MVKPRGSKKVGLFVFPSWMLGNKEKEIRNDYTIDRIKWTMGTGELPTAELTFDGTVAYPLGPLEKGLANVVEIVLTNSRLTVGMGTASGLARAAREARKYSEFRTTFGGTPINAFPMLEGQLERASRRATAGVFNICGLVFGLKGGMRGGLTTKPFVWPHPSWWVTA